MADSGGSGGTSTTSAARNGDGTISSVTNGRGVVTGYGYDARAGHAGELTGIDYPAPLGDETITYDQLSRVVSVSDGAGKRTSYGYDGRDRLVSITTGDGAVTTYTYDGAGNRVRQVDTPPGGAGKVTVTTFDLLNEVTTEDRAVGGSVSYTWDAAGNLASVSDPGGSVAYAYTPVNLLSTLTEVSGTGAGGTGAGGAVTSFGYDGDNRRTSITWPGGLQQVSSFDSDGRVLSITAHAGGSGGAGGGGSLLSGLTYTYQTNPSRPAGQQATGLRASVTDTVAGQRTSYSYDARDRLAAASVTSTSGGGVLHSYAYSYDTGDNRTRATVDGASVTAAYNAADQVCWSAPGVLTPSCGSTPAGGTSYSYDGAGNQTRAAVSTPGASTTGLATGLSAVLGYNGADQTVSITPPNASARPQTYLGTTQGDRVTTKDTAGTASNVVTYTLTNALTGVTVRSSTGGDGSGTPTGVEADIRDNTGHLISRRTTTGVRQAYLSDALGSTLALVDTTTAGGSTLTAGTLNRRYSYDPYGTTVTITGPTGAVIGSDDNPYRYAGGYTDNTTGLIKYGIRYYQPTLGTWTQPDPTGQDTHPYTYARCNPTNNTDPTGALSGCDVASALLGADLGVGVGSALVILEVGFGVATGVGALVSVGVSLLGAAVCESA